MKNLLVTALAVTTVFLSGCAAPNTASPQGTQEEIQGEKIKQIGLSFKRMMQEDQHVADVAYPILAANAPLCVDTKYTMGLSFWNRNSVPKEFQSFVTADYALDENFTVRTVTKGSAAEKVGVKAGDRVLTLNGRKISTGEKAAEDVANIMGSANAAEVKIGLERNGKAFEKTVRREKVCNYETEYEPADQTINAYANGKSVYIPRGMLRFVDNDTELALVIAHELAHNAMGHVDMKQANSMAAGSGGALIDILFAAAGVNTSGAFMNAASKAGMDAYSVEFEQEADYVGMYFLARAGYKTDGVANFWRRISTEVDGTSSGGSHPSAPARYIAIEKINKEIQDKKAKGQKLVPEIKTNAEIQKRVKVKTGYNN